MTNNELAQVTRLEHEFIVHEQKRITKAVGVLAVFELLVILALVAMEAIR